MKEYRIPQKEKIDLDTFQEPDESFAGYSYADYLKWDFEEIVELIKGKVFKKAAAPNRKHQEVSRDLTLIFGNFLKGHKCKVYAAPFDVRFARNPEDNKVDSVVQPDISVICDSSKLDDKGCFDAPDLIVEILSPSNSRVELHNKFELYQEFGVREYWIIHPMECSLLIYTLVGENIKPQNFLLLGTKFGRQCFPVSNWIWRKFFWKIEFRCFRRLKALEKLSLSDDLISHLKNPF